MPLIKNAALADDPWVAVADDEPIPLEAQPIVTLDRWKAERETLLGRNAPLGIRLRSDQPPSEIAEDLGHFDLVALEFPKFTDGRAYSYARLLRERHGFEGELRAVGNVLRDQLLFMARCGFDAFELPEGAPVETWLRALEDFSVWYQPTADGRPTAWQLRRALAGNGAGPRGEAAGAPSHKWTLKTKAGAGESVARSFSPTGGAVRSDPVTANWAY